MENNQFRITLPVIMNANSYSIYEPGKIISIPVIINILYIFFVFLYKRFHFFLYILHFLHIISLKKMYGTSFSIRNLILINYLLK